MIERIDRARLLARIRARALRHARRKARAINPFDVCIRDADASFKRGALLLICIIQRARARSALKSLDQIKITRINPVPFRDLARARRRPGFFQLPIVARARGVNSRYLNVSITSGR